MSPAGVAGWVDRLGRGLGRSSARLAGGITELFSGRSIDAATMAELRDLLISADLGAAVAERLSGALAERRFAPDAGAAHVRAALADDIEAILAPLARPLDIDAWRRPHVIVVCGVNGSGKTTTIAKLAKRFREDGHSVLLVAGDTFRAAAIEQLEVWGERVGCPVMASAPGADAAALAFDALTRAKHEGTGVVVVDTAGRLHNKADLMAQLQKIVRVLGKVDGTAPHDCILVLDAGVGQNAHAQVETFAEMVSVSGLVLTKLDGTARGGVVVALAERFGLPVHAVGVGESLDDLRPFEARAFARSLLAVDD